MVKEEIIEMKSSGENGETRRETSIGWRNLRFQAREWFGRERKVILNRLNGCFEYHSLNAFMGPSGAGKTTLLNCLNGNRVKGLTPESEIYLNKDQRGGNVVSYFIEQHVERTIVGKMRVGQILRYAYRFKNGIEGDMEGHIRKTIDELLLDELVLNRNFEQCSGGEQKRVAIAQELMSLQKPTLLFVDEPTTGLDSNAAHLVMKCLRQLATNHRMAIITSIHVPSDDILTLFDKLYVLAKGGVCIYSGRPDQLRSHLAIQIKYLVIPKEQPPIEALTKIACSGIADPRVVSLSSHTLSEEYHNVTTRLPELSPFPNGVPNTRKFFSPWHLLLQTCRMFQITFVAQINLFLLQLLVGGIYLLFIASLFSWDMVHPSGCYSYASDNSTGCSNFLNQDSLLMQNVNFHGLMLFYYAMIIMTRGAVFYCGLTAVFNNEHRNQWYSSGVYFWSTTIVGTIQASLFAALYLLFGYLYTGQHYVDNYEIFGHRIGYILMIYLVLAIYTDCFGQLIGTIFMSKHELSVVMSVFVYMFFSMLYGFFIDLEFTNIFVIQMVGKLSGFSSMFKSVLFYVYGWNRCLSEDSYSLILMDYHVEPKEVPGYPYDLLINIVLIRLSILVYMFWRFNTFGKRSTIIEKETAKEMAPIDFENKSKQVEVEMSKHDLITARNKSKEEIEFEKFSRGKIIVAWRDLSLYRTNLIFERTTTVEDGIDEKAILKNLNGEFRFGTLNALMGTSGAGKTSLLKVLNGRDKTRLSAQSQFYLSKFTRIQTCFITQDVSGHLLPGLTAKQMLVYASRLKNSELRESGVDTSQIDHQKIALNLLDELNLSDTVDTLVERCSGGERKRLALALELTALHMPNLICIDEPTSGLDSNSSEVVVACLRKLTQNHSITIVTSIHQPNTEVLLMFDQIYVLARGGVCIYSGAPTSILPHLQTVPETLSFDCKFPIESLVKQSCHSFQDPIVHQLMSNNDLKFDETVVTSGLLEQQTQLVADGIQINRRRFSLEDTWILCIRYLAYIRGHLWMELLAFICLFLCYGLFLSQLFDPIISTVSGCVSLDDDFNNTCTKTEEKIYEDNLLKYNFQYLFVSFIMFLVLLVIQTSITYSRESIYFFNEHRNGWYSSGSFYLMKTVFDTIPVVLILVPLYVYICDIYESVRPGIYFDFLLVMIISSIAYQGVGHIISLVSGGEITLLMIMLVSMLLFFTFLSNFFVPVTRLHYIHRLISQFSIPRYMLQSVIILLYGYDRCLPKQIQPLMYQLSIHDSDYYSGLIVLVFNLILYRVIAISLLYYSSNPEQNRRHHIERVNNHVSKLRPTNTIVAGLDSDNEFRIKLIRF